MSASLVLVRHGQSEWNEKNLFTGWKDPGLTAKGVEEAKSAGIQLRTEGFQFDVMFTSDLLRAQKTGEIILKELGVTTIMINNNPDGYNINRNCGATDTKQLQQEVLKQDANLGIAFDGDGDRLIMVDHLGEKVDGDELVYIIAKAWKNNGELKSDTVVGTKMTNLGMRKALGELGLTFIEADVGDRHVMDELINNNAILGGEGSGHIICLNKSTSGDAIIAALQVLEVISKSQKTLYDLKTMMTKYPQVLVNIKIENDINLKNNSNLVDAINLTESKLSDKGRILIRKSGTEALVRVMVECNDLELATESANYLADVIKSM